MSAVLHFTPRAELEPQENLLAFIEQCRQSEVLDACRQFEQNIWDLGYFKGQNKVNRAVFSTREAARVNTAEPCLPQPFLDFAKAVLVYLHDKRPVTSQSLRIAALRCLEAALREWNKASRPTAVTVDVLDTAVELARQQLSASVAYRVAGQLELIAQLMNDKDFIALRQPWLHGMKKPQESNSRISKEAVAARQEKLPSAATLRALGEIFQQATEPTDVVVSSFTALLLCAPERINEVLRLRRNCLVEGEGEFRGKLGLRWAGSKGFDDTTKWLPSEMTPVAREAVAKLLHVSAPAQQLAAWYTEHPNTLYLHEDAKHLRNQEVLTLAEVALILWGNETATNSANTWAQKANQLPKIQLNERKIGFRFEDVERAVVAMLPPTFPDVIGASGLRCTEAMALSRINELSDKKATCRCMFTCVDYGSITNRLGNRFANESIFVRFGYTEDDGSPIELKSHSLRHYLNTLAQMGGLSSAEIAIFSGRQDVKQNRAYDHMSSDEIQAPINAALQAGFTSTLMVAPGSRNLVERKDYRDVGFAAVHTTPYGWCAHAIASEPCQKYRNCINCEEQVCIKGEAHKEGNLRQLKEETAYFLGQAREALTDEEYNADTWVKQQTMTLERINMLLAVLEDPAVALGAQIRLDLTNAPLITSGNTPPLKPETRGRKRLLK